MIQPKLIASSLRQESYLRNFQQALQNLSQVEKELGRGKSASRLKSPARAH